MAENSVYEYYNEHAKRCDPLDFLRQVKRTVNGQPVPQDQIDLIVRTIVSGLELTPDDTLLDLGCGNGALTDLIFECCAGGVGVDIGDYLIAVAQVNFARPDRVYICDDVVRYVTDSADGRRFTRALSYSAFQYLPSEVARRMLVALRRRFPNITRVFLGNLPDRARIGNFYTGDYGAPRIEYDPAIGTWRSQSELMKFARSCGWEARCSTMPPSFYAAHYRFDAVLHPL